MKRLEFVDMMRIENFILSLKLLKDGLRLKKGGTLVITIQHLGIQCGVKYMGI